MVVVVVVALLLAAPANADEPPGVDAALEAEIEAATTSVTLAAWLAEHPSEPVERFSTRPSAPAPRWAGEHDAGRWCARTVRTGCLGDGRRWQRTAYFFDPAPPPDLALPAGASEALIRTCLLGLVWIETTPRARTALSNAAQALLGEGRAPPRDGVGGFGAASWRDVAEWRGPEGRYHVFLGTDPGHPPRLGARGFLRIATPVWDQWAFWNLEISGGLRAGARATMQRGRDRLRRTLGALAGSVRALSGMDADAREAMLAHLAERADGDGSRQARDLEQIEAFARATRRLPPAERVDALLVADRVAGAVGLIYPAPREGRSFYSHVYLLEALRIAPAGAAKDRAFVRQMELGFDMTDGYCSAGPEVFEKVIATGEPLVSRTEEQEIRIATHLFLGDAYTTIVALAEGEVPPEFADARKYARRAPAAREKAVEHLRAAIALESESERAREAWNTAWRLLAGLPPTRARFFCFWD